MILTFPITITDPPSYFSISHAMQFAIRLYMLQLYVVTYLFFFFIFNADIS